MTATLRVIGDVHGDLVSFDAALRALPTPDFVLQVGDLVDRGPDSAGCLRRVLELRAAGTGIALRGNHDDKLARLLLGNPVKPGADLQRTVVQLRAEPDGDRLISAFLAGWPTTPWWHRHGDYLFVHGAYHPAMLDAVGPEKISDRWVRDKVKWLALYGEGQISGDDDLPKRTYGWIDLIPAGLTVVVGHDVRSQVTPLETLGTLGGRALFLDTGCGKGGHLSRLDLGSNGTEKLQSLLAEAKPAALRNYTSGPTR